MLREKLAQGQPLVGTFIAIPSPSVVEVASLAGLDFLVLDMEHGEIDRGALPDLLRAADAAGVPALVRVPEISRQLFLPSLDAGAAGVMVPQVETANQAREAVSQVKHPPEGKRGAALNRSTKYGRGTVPDCFEEANRNTVVCVQCESTGALENLGAIAGVEGIDVLFVGPLDLSHSMGLTGQREAPRMKKAIRKVLDVAGSHNLATGITATDDGELKRRFDQGFNLMVYSTDFLVLMEEYGSTAAFVEKYRNNRS